MKKHMKMTRSQGPWEVDNSGDIGSSIAITNSKGDDICFCEPFYGEEEANARLIATAPELLEICKKCYSLLFNGIKQNLVKELKQVIAKAEGD